MKRKDTNTKPAITSHSFPSLLKTFITGGITNIANSQLKGLSPEFQQNAITVCETIIKHGTASEKQQLITIYNSCVKRAAK